MPAIAFFDVDETVIRIKSMFSFLAHLCSSPLGAGRLAPYAETMADLQRLAEAGTPRQAINRHYYGLFRGLPAAEVAGEARRWYDGIAAGAPVLIGWSAREVRRLQAADAEVVFVSGSFADLITPVGAELGVTSILCTRPEVVGDCFTGEVLGEPMIGEAKGTAVREYMRRRGAIPAECHAYADHVSDLTMLQAVGQPTAINPDPALRAHALAGGWRIRDER